MVAPSGQKLSAEGFRNIDPLPGMPSDPSSSGRRTHRARRRIGGSRAGGGGDRDPEYVEATKLTPPMEMTASIPFELKGVGLGDDAVATIYIVVTGLALPVLLPLDVSKQILARTAIALTNPATFEQLAAELTAGPAKQIAKALRGGLKRVK